MDDDYEEMQSDIVLRLFLESLTPEDVLHELDPAPLTIEDRWVTKARERQRGTWNVYNQPRSLG